MGLYIPSALINKLFIPWQALDRLRSCESMVYTLITIFGFKDFDISLDTL